MNVPGMTYNKDAPVKMMIAGKEVEMSEADYAEKQLKDSLIPKKAALDKVNLTGANIVDPIVGKPILNADGTANAYQGILGTKLYATDSKVRDAGRIIREDIKDAAANIVTSGAAILKPFGTFFSGLFGSDGTPDVFASVTERVLTPDDISALNDIDKDMKNLVHIVRSDPRDRATVHEATARYSSRYNSALDIHKYGTEYVKARRAKEAADANAKLAAASK